MATLSELQPWLQPYARWLLEVARYNGLGPTVTSVYRSAAKQQQLYDRYLKCRAAGGDCLPAVPPGHSQHGLRLAFDLVVKQGYRSAEQAALGRVWASIGGFWSPSDPVHFAVRRA